MACSYTTVASAAILLILSSSCIMNISCTGVVIPLTSNTFSTFVTSSNVRLVHVSYAASTKNIESFLIHYKKAAEQLGSYGILSGQVICDEFSNFEYCKREKTERFLFGFRGTKERLVLPLSTLADENAIVASALHLALIYSVPIIQTSAELYKLERKCYGKCNIVLAYHNTLGTLEHKLFLQLAWENQHGNVFALTTSLHASPGDGSTSSILNPPVRISQVPYKQLVGLWLLQCKQFTPSLPHHEPCPASLFRNNFSFHNIKMFTKALQLPVWLDIEGQFPSIFAEYDLHEVILVYDEASKSRVEALAEPLGLAFRGSIGILTCPVNNLEQTWLVDLQHKIFPPSLVFVSSITYEDSTYEVNILNELEGAYDFILEQLKYEEQYEISKENDMENNFNYFLKTPLSGFEEDNELAKQVTSFKVDWKYLDNTKQDNQCAPDRQYELRLYYLDWDVISQIILILLEDLSYLVKPEAVSCFVESDTCNKIEMFPTLEIISLYQSKRFGSFSMQSLYHEIYSFTSPQVAIYWNRNSILAELNSHKYNYITEVVIMATWNLNETNPVAKILDEFPRKILLLVAIYDAAAFIRQEFSCALPCLIIKKIPDSTPIEIYRGNIQDLNHTRQFFINSLLPALPLLTPELIPLIRNKILVASLCDFPSQEYIKAAQSMANTKFVFTWVPSNSMWFKDVLIAHAATIDNTLIALDLKQAYSYMYPPGRQQEDEITLWLQGILRHTIPATKHLEEKEWKPLKPAVDYLKLLEDERNKQDESIMLDTEDPFVSTEAPLETFNYSKLTLI